MDDFEGLEFGDLKKIKADDFSELGVMGFLKRMRIRGG